MDIEKPPLNITAKVHRGLMTSEAFEVIKKHQGVYDVLVESKGNPKYIDRDQIGFRHGTLNIDVAFQSDRQVYEFAGERDGQPMTILGSISTSGKDKDDVRRFVSQVTGRLYIELLESGLPDMEIQSFIKTDLVRYKAQIPTRVIEFSQN